ncbi:MAG: DUF2284 domain-containing protein, partial [Bacillota bacterium]|nr:DUF2284 domain-containing protein [Bacillota bacterium]
MSEMEIKTVYSPAGVYRDKYRDIPKFLQYCKACPRYNRCWACPPHEFAAADLVDSYEHVYIIGAKVSIDEGLQQNVRGRDAVTEMAESITREARKKLDPIILGFEQSFGESLACYGGT